MRLNRLLLSGLLALSVSTLGAQQAPAAKPVATAKPSLEITAPRDMDSVRFAIIGDTGTGDRRQYEVGAQMTQAMQIFPFEFVIMLGDNIYGSERPQDFVKKFEKPYEGILSQKIPFYASLGNHDDPTQRYYKPFNMNGERFYTFKKGDARFFALDSNYMDPKELMWLDKELAASGSGWKIMFFHHPLYSSGETHGSAEQQRGLLEPLFLKHGVNVVLSGHEHFYERIKPQKGIAYFIIGSSAKLRKGDLQKSDLTAFGDDGEWKTPRIISAQFQNVSGNDIGQFKDMSRQIVVWPPELKTGNLVYPYAQAAR